MYKLFLCLRYLRRRYLALIGVLSVTLCVAMVLIVVSVMDGFLRKVELAAKGLFGDIIVDATSLSGIGRYDEFIAALTGQYRLDGPFAAVGDGGEGGQMVFQAEATPAQVEALAGAGKVQGGTIKPDRRRTFPARAAVYVKGRKAGELTGQLALDTDGKLTFSGQGAPAAAGPPVLGPVYAQVGQGLPEIAAATPIIYSVALLRIDTDYTTMVQICGIRLPERLAVTDFEGGLFAQAGHADATFDPPLELLLARTAEHVDLIDKEILLEQARPADRRDEELLQGLFKAKALTTGKVALLEDGVTLRQLIERRQAELAAEQARPPDRRNDDQIKQLQEIVDLGRADLARAFGTPDRRVILGLGIAGLSLRTPDGETVRLITPGHKVVLSLLPVGRGRISKLPEPVTRTLFVADDAKTGIYQIDSKFVYVPFNELQLLADMAELRGMDDPADVDPARCSQIQIKVKPAFASPQRLVGARTKVRRAWREFLLHRPEAAGSEVTIRTWREKLDKFIGPVQKQRTLVTIMFGIISFVAVMVIFSIFYMIVVQKTRDIGVVRAVGGSAAGVAQIFLAYGTAVGVVGSILGLTVGYVFVRYINPIEDFFATYFGYRVWDRDVFLFDEIPNEVDPSVAVAIAAWAIVSGVIGALIPAVGAATLEPVEAIRYE